MRSSGTIRLLIVKAVIWSVALGSGTSDGVLAPLLIIGGVVGSLFGMEVSPGSNGMWPLVGMAAMMGGTMRAPRTSHRPRIRRSRHKSYPVVDRDGRLVGVISRADALQWLLEEAPTDVRLSEHVSGQDVVVGYDDEPVGRLADRMAASGKGRIPIVT